MKFRGLLVALAALAVLGGLAWWSEKRQQAGEGKASADESPKLLTIPEDQFQEVRIERAGAATVVSRGNDGKWQITAPQPLPADQDSVNSLVSTLSSLSTERLIDEKAQALEEYGLDHPSLQAAVVLKDGKTERVLLGDETPTGGGYFAKRAEDGRVFTVASWVKSSIDKTPNDLRDKRLLTFDSDKLTRVELLAKGQAIEFGKNNQNEWQILKPRPLRADGSQVEELVRQLREARMEIPADEREAAKSPAAFASGSRAGVANVSDASGTQTLDVRRSGENYYARSSVVQGVYRVSSSLGEALSKGMEDFRNKKLFDFGWNDPARVQVKTGETTATYEKSGEKWLAGGSKEMDPSTVQALIDRLRDLSAAKFAETAAGTQIFEATVTSNDGKRVETVTISKQGDTYYGRRANEPSVYVLDAHAVDELQSAAGAVREPAPPESQEKKK